MSDNKIKVINNSLLFDSVEDLLASGLSVELRIKGHSMRPFMRSDRDVVKLIATSADQLQRGMVVLFRHNGRHVLHRFRRRKEKQLLFAGDGNSLLTELAAESDVVAMVESFVRNNRQITYGTARWRAMTCYSLCIKWLRTPIYIAKQIIKKIIGRS